ncbi:MAG: two-component system alkaline phosphatase synthesis response regulator PhoP [Candidatus Azotimanducaceae bacterium]|jgi:two-component system alkaline phosphatase synthesis response regulator PhoP
MLYKMALDETGLHTLTAENGSDAVTMALEHHPDVILMDILIPQMNDHKAVEQIRIDGGVATQK